jgi:hypothetical protein
LCPAPDRASAAPGAGGPPAGPSRQDPTLENALTDAELAAAGEEIERLRERIRQRDAENARDRARLDALVKAAQGEQRRRALLSLVGVAGGVRLSHVTTGRMGHLVGLAGTLTKLRHSRCTVDFGHAGRWEVRIAQVIPAGRGGGRP